MAEGNDAHWVTKQEALALTGWKERTLERWMQKGLIRRMQRAVPGLRPVAILHRDDIKKILETQEQEAQKAKQPAVLKTAQRKPTRDITRHAAAIVPQLPVLAATPPPCVPIERKIFLTVAEASEFSGLSPTFLRRAIKAGTLPAQRDGGYKIKRAHLEQIE